MSWPWKTAIGERKKNRPASLKGNTGENGQVCLRVGRGENGYRGTLEEWLASLERQRRAGPLMNWPWKTVIGVRKRNGSPLSKKGPPATKATTETRRS